jgi:hypothetical protein
MIETFEMEDANGITEYVRIVNGDTATIMTKENYDKQQAEAALSTPIVVEHLTEIPTKGANSDYQAYLNKDTLVTESAPTA